MKDSVDQRAAVRNIDFCRTWLLEELDDVMVEYDYATADDAFEALTASLVLNIDYDAILPDEVVDGPQDKHIDVLRIEEDPGRGTARISIIQAKKESGFSSNAVIQLKNGLDWLFGSSKVDYEGLKNQALVNKIGEIRQLLHEYGPSNITVAVYFATLGDTQALPAEYVQERKSLNEKYAGIGFADFRFSELDAVELFDRVNEGARRERRIDLDISIIYDVNQASLLRYGAGDTRAVICTVTGAELARIASVEPRDAIFDLNVRPFYGSRGRVNKGIWDTCTGDDSLRFWFLNNGITMVCDSIDPVIVPDNPVVKVKNAQIVNGCQTSVTVREVWEQGRLRDDVRVLLRVYATDNPNLSDRITVTTNSQNSITDRDLHANDSIQRDIQQVMQDEFQYFYERKNKQFREFHKKQRERIVPNDKAAQAYLAVVRRKPSQARGYLGKVWSEYYEEIFGNAAAEDLLASFLIFRYAAKRARQAKSDASLPSLRKTVAVYGMFHLARIIGFQLLRDKWGAKNRSQLAEFIKRVESGEDELAIAYDDAMDLLVNLRASTSDGEPNPTLYFKAGAIEKLIESAIDSEKKAEANLDNG